MATVLEQLTNARPARRTDRLLAYRARAARRHTAPLPVVDACAVAAATVTMLVVHHELGNSTGRIGWVLLFDVVTLLTLRVRRLQDFRLRSSVLDTIAATATSSVMAAGAVITLRSVVAPDVAAAAETFGQCAFVVAFLVLARTVRSANDLQACKRGVGRRTLIIGAGVTGRSVARRLLERPAAGLQPIGFLDNEPLVTDTEAGDLPVLGGSRHLEDVVRYHEVEQVFIAFSTAPHHVLLDLVRRCQRLGVGVSVVPRLFEEMTGRVDVEFLGGISLLRLQPGRRQDWEFAVKQAFDRVLAGVGLALLSPLMLLLAMGVRLSSPGPIFYRQRRVGLDGHEFEMLKFRSMVGSPETHGESDGAWIASHLGGGKAAIQSDRVTALGRVLRRFSLDELPQLINVTRGDMSLVGPRPERTAMVRNFERTISGYGDRHRVRPGMTGWAQVQGLRGETSLTDRVEWDNHYIQNWNPWLDLKILVLTVPAVFRRSVGK